MFAPQVLIIRSRLPTHLHYFLLLLLRWIHRSRAHFEFDLTTSVVAIITSSHYSLISLYLSYSNGNINAVETGRKFAALLAR